MSILAAILLALAIVSAQAFHGGLFIPALTVPTYALLAVAALPALWVALRNSVPDAPATLATVLILVGYVVWRCVHAPDPFLGRVELGQALGVGLAFAIAYGGLRNSGGRFVFVGILIGAAVVQAVIGFVQFAHGSLQAPLGWMSGELQSVYATRFATRAHGFFLNPNQFAWLMGWGTLVCLALAVWGKMSVVIRVVLAYLAVLFLSADVLSGSRSGVASLAVGLLVFTLTSVAAAGSVLRHGRGAVVFGTFALVALGLGVGWAVYSSNWVMQARMDAIFFPDVRGFLLEHGWRQFQATPLIGAGPGMFLYAARLYRTGEQAGDAVFAHNDWLQGLVEYGFVGMALALVAMVAVVAGGGSRLFTELRRRAGEGESPRSNSTALLLGALSAMVTFAVHSFADFNLHVPANALLAGATAGLLAGVGRTVPAPGNLMSAAVLRGFSGLAIAGLAIFLGLSTWRHAEADYRHLRASNAMVGGDVAGALLEIDEGLKRQPEDAALLALRGRALYAYESARQFDPTSEGGRSSGEILFQRGRRAIYGASAEALHRVVEQRPQERSLRIDLARALFEVRQRREGHRQLVEAIRLDPAHGFAYRALGDYLERLGKFNQALRIYELGSVLPGGEYPAKEAQRMREMRDANPRPARLESLVPAPTGPGHAPGTPSNS